MRCHAHSYADGHADGDHYPNPHQHANLRTNRHSDGHANQLADGHPHADEYPPNTPTDTPTVTPTNTSTPTPTHTNTPKPKPTKAPTATKAALASIIGRCVDVKGNPLSGVKVSITLSVDGSAPGLETETGNDGSFTVNDVPTGHVSIITTLFYPAKRKTYLLPIMTLDLKPGQVVDYGTITLD